VDLRASPEVRRRIARTRERGVHLEEDDWLPVIAQGLPAGGVARQAGRSVSVFVEAGPRAGGAFLPCAVVAPFAFERARSHSVTPMTTQTWIITGASRGFGRALAEAALAAGDHVVAAVRRPESVADLTDQYPDSCLIAEFDARDTAAAANLVGDTLDRFGRLDVLVNNAGRGVVGAVEEVGDAQLRELMDLHLFGPAALVRAALPAMRERGTGTIIQMSSQGGRMSFPGVSAYSASKFALEGWSEALAGEVAPFGIRVMIVEPSRFRTGFHAADALEFTESSEIYRDLLAAVRTDLAGADGLQEGDPQRAAQIIVSLAHSDEVPLRLPLGREAVERISGAYRRGLEEVERWAATARSADYEGVPASVRPI
jgi:NAD(P)-dependent dehydrogenase (short-subunit alcohol dehydrogenase family)